MLLSLILNSCSFRRSISFWCKCKPNVSSSLPMRYRSNRWKMRSIESETERDRQRMEERVKRVRKRYWKTLVGLWFQFFFFFSSSTTAASAFGPFFLFSCRISFVTENTQSSPVCRMHLSFTNLRLLCSCVCEHKYTIADANVDVVGSRECGLAIATAKGDTFVHGLRHYLLVPCLVPRRIGCKKCFYDFCVCAGFVSLHLCRPFFWSIYWVLYVLRVSVYDERSHSVPLYVPNDGCFSL